MDSVTWLSSSSWNTSSVALERGGKRERKREGEGMERGGRREGKKEGKEDEGGEESM